MYLCWHTIYGSNPKKLILTQYIRSYLDQIHMSECEFKIICAMCCEDNGIGLDNKLPWRIPEDLQQFKELTMGHVVIMGRKTFEAIGRVLPGRTNIVLTRTPSAFSDALPQTTGSHPVLHPVYTDEVGLAQTLDAIGAKCAFIIGGSEIYRMFITKATEIYLTKINKHYDCDSFFPDFDSTKYHLKNKSIEYYSEQEGCTFHYEHYKKKS